MTAIHADRARIRVLYAEDNRQDTDLLRTRLAEDAPEIGVRGVETGEACLRSAPGFIAFDDDSGDASCPRLTAMCPPSGRIAINANPFGGGMFTCTYAMVRGGAGP